MSTAQEGRARGTLVEALSSALERGSSGLANAPTLLRRMLAEGSWREFVTQRGEVVVHERFEEFVATPPLRGIGASMNLIRKIVDSIEDKAERAHTQDLLDQALQREPGRPSETVDNIHDSERPAGTSQAAALRRLRKDAPDLHSEVLAGHLSAHAAMVKAGFRPRTASVRLDDPEAVVRTLRKNMDPEQWEALRRLVTDAG